MKNFVLTLIEQCPQQRINEIVSLPKKPSKFNVNVDYVNPLKRNIPTGSPRKLIYLFGVEWAWSPAHNRMDHYYLNLKPNHWFFWNYWLDDCSEQWKWEWIFLSYANIGCKDLKAIASHMMLDFWEKEKEFQGLDHYHFIDNTGLFSVEEVQAISREAW